MRSAITSFLSHYPRLNHLVRRVLSGLLPGTSVSSDYVFLRGEVAGEEGQRLRESWQNETLPERQRELVDQQLCQYRSGARIDVFNVFADSLRALPKLSAGATLLEVGCSSGFYSEVIDIANLQFEYSGCDYSDAFIRLAKEKYPSVAFSVEDATSLNYLDDSFDVVVSGCCLLHIPEYVKAVSEASRVARHYVVFHRTPVVWGQPEQWYRKLAYGVETVEIHFNEAEFLTLLEESGLELIATYTLSEGSTFTSPAQGHADRTYVCRTKN